MVYSTEMHILMLLDKDPRLNMKIRDLCKKKRMIDTDDICGLIGVHINLRPSWLKNEKTNRNLELDIVVACHKKDQSIELNRKILNNSNEEVLFAIEVDGKHHCYHNQFLKNRMCERLNIKMLRLKTDLYSNMTIKKSDEIAEKILNFLNFI